MYSQMGPCARPQYCQGTKPEGEDPQYHSGSPVPEDRQVQNWLSSAWVGAIGQESFLYLESKSIPVWGEIIFKHKRLTCAIICSM